MTGRPRYIRARLRGGGGAAWVRLILTHWERVSKVSANSVASRQPQFLSIHRWKGRSFEEQNW